jgi:hypothetical protein
MVTPKGFEPPTNRTGICHSIQLNYGAVYFYANITPLFGYFFNIDEVASTGFLIIKP